ncbi:MAG: hypothetical protein D6718_05450 [Acidobacteria bacterium]|nr:MAG: hypothetical protein D6718_05450 [Acidobacteriota bacterium]
MGRELAVGLALLAAACAPPGLDSIASREDARVPDRRFWSRALAAGEPAVRAAAARAIGRLRDPGLAPLLAGRLGAERSPAVREEILFALGQAGGEAARSALRAALAAVEPGQRMLACEALGKVGGREEIGLLARALGDPAEEVRGAAALALARLAGRHAAEPVPLDAGEAGKIAGKLASLLRASGAGERWRAAYALAEIEALPLPAPELEAALADGDPRVRLFAARALARAGPGAALALGERLADPSPHVAAAAALALARAAGPQAAGPLLDALDRAAGPAAHHLRLAALEALEALPLPREAAGRIEALAASDPSPRVRGAALRLLARLAPVRALPLFRAAERSRNPYLRAAAARAARNLPVSEAVRLLRRLRLDADPRPASAALETLGEIAPATARAEALEALRSKDVAIAGTAADLLGRVGHPGDVAALERLYGTARGPERVELRLGAVRSAGRLDPARAERFLRAALADPAPAVALAARDALEAAGEEGADPSPGHWRSTAPAWPRGRPAPRVTLRTDRGDIVLQLDPEAAPHHVASFVARAREGKLDGLPFHRVVTGFVVQGLDPRGDGWGTGGVLLRDEIAPLRFDGAGVVGMPNAGPDTGGCQIFVTLAPAPHLDGRFTVFARVVEGLGVVDTLDVGDRCRRAIVQ